MKTRLQPHIEAWLLVLMVAIGHGFSVKWDSPSILLLCIFLIVGLFHIVFREITSRLQPPTVRYWEQVRQMTPAGLEQYLDTLDPEERRRFAAHLLEVSPDDDYLAKLSPEQRREFDALLSRLKAEQPGGVDPRTSGGTP